MALTRIDLCSRALLKIGAHSIASFDEGTAEAEVAAGLYTTVRDTVLLGAPVGFRHVSNDAAEAGQSSARRLRQCLPAAAGLHPRSFGRTSGRGQGIRYKIKQRQLHADEDDVVLTYIARPDELDFPPFFDMALITQLAAEFCIPLTDSTSRWESLQKVADADLRRARLIDAQEETPSSVEDFTLLEGRA